MRALPRALLTVTVVAVALTAARAAALDDAHREKGEQIAQRAIEYLRNTQSEEGAWSPRVGPAVTGLITAGLLRDPAIDRDDPTVARALDYIMARQQDDGGFYDSILKNYNTSISVMALAQVGDDPAYAQAIARAQEFLRDLQWVGQEAPDGERVVESHPYFGGAGYGNHGRPDMSNTTMMLAALYDSGMDCTDPVFINALRFVERCQGVKYNEMHGEQIEQDGGFIYSTSINKDLIGVPESKANPEEMARVKEGQPLKSRLRTYGSITYAGFMSYLYAQLDRDDPRVQAAFDWIRKNYTLEENPGVGMQGYYYYLHVFARALTATGQSSITTADGRQIDWANDLIDQLAELQREDGSFVNDQDRWMEGDPHLVTAYALNALQIALGR